MGNEEALGALTRQLSDADDRTLLKIVQVIDGLARRGGLDQLLDRHRARLALIRPPRPMTAGRIFVLPFEELLIHGSAWNPGVMRVPRDRLSELIELVFERLPPGFEQKINKCLSGRTMEDAAFILEIGRELWPACADAALRTLEHGRQTRDPRIRELLLPLRICGLLLPVAEAAITTLWSLPPKPVLDLDEAAQQRIVALLDTAGAAGRDCFQLVAELLIDRTGLPFSIIVPILAGAGALGQRERQQAAAMIAETCLATVMKLHREVLAMPETVEPVALAGPVQTLVSTIESLQDLAAKVSFDHRALRRLRTELFDLVLARLTRALSQDLLETLKQLDATMPAADWRRLERNATAVANMRLMAKRIGLASKGDFLFSKATDRYRDLVASAASPREENPLPDAISMDRLRIIELIFGSPAALRILADLRNRPAGQPAAAKS